MCHSRYVPENEIKMTTRKQYTSVYFVGAGGIGMAALVRYYLLKGLKVAGYDRTRTALTDALTAEGAEIVYDDSETLIPDWCRDKETTLVVYTPAIPDSHPGLRWFRAEGFDIMKRAQVLGLITHDSLGLCFSGTHGKTTTSSMAAHILNLSKVGCNAFLGGILRNYDSNFLYNAGSRYTVIEADEFDRSFHWLNPYVAVVTATDPDHLDIYGTKEAYLESFHHYTTLIQRGGALIIHTNLEMRHEVAEGVKVYTYSRDEGDFHAENIVIDNGEITFDFVSPVETVRGIQLGQPVPINIDNSIAAMAMAQLNGCTAEELRYGMKTYHGVDRRFDFKLKDARHVFLSDYAHHPKEIYQSAKSIRELYKTRKITAIFQPHLYTRTRDFYKDFADALSQLDEVILCDIYPAREQPIPGVTSQLIYDNLKPGVEKSMIHKEDVLQLVKDRDFDVLVVLGAGDLDNYVPQITKILESK